MLYDHVTCRDILFSALMNALTEHAGLIRKLEAKHKKDWSGGIVAMSYDILPWQPFVALSFRTIDDPDIDLDNSADWNGYELIGDHNASESLAPVYEYITAAYESVQEDPDQCQELNHMVNLAAAEALLDLNQANPTFTLLGWPRV